MGAKRGKDFPDTCSFSYTHKSTGVQTGIKESSGKSGDMVQAVKASVSKLETPPQCIFHRILSRFLTNENNVRTVQHTYWSSPLLTSFYLWRKTFQSFPPRYLFQSIPASRGRDVVLTLQLSSGPQEFWKECRQMEMETCRYYFCGWSASLILSGTILFNAFSLCLTLAPSLVFRQMKWFLYCLFMLIDRKGTETLQRWNVKLSQFYC